MIEAFIRWLDRRELALLERRLRRRRFDLGCEYIDLELSVAEGKLPNIVDGRQWEIEVELAALDETLDLAR